MVCVCGAYIRVCAHVCVCTCHSENVEVRGQLEGIGSLLPLNGLTGKCPYMLSDLVNPEYS